MRLDCKSHGKKHPATTDKSAPGNLTDHTCLDFAGAGNCIALDPRLSRRPKNHVETAQPHTDQAGVDLQPSLTNSPDFYDEPEGIFPDGKFTTVEHGSSLKSAFPLIDIHKLALDGSGKLQRLTHFNDFPSWNASRSVVSDDGRSLLFQIGKAGDEAGQGYGVFMLDLTKVPVEP